VRAFVNVLRIIAGVLLLLSVTLNFVNVVARYFFNASFHWAEESMLFLMVGCVFLGNGVVAWTGRQIRMDVIIGMMPRRLHDALNLVAELVFIATALIIVYFASPVILDLYSFDQRSQSAEIPMYIPQSWCPSACRSWHSWWWCGSSPAASRTHPANRVTDRRNRKPQNSREVSE